MFSSRVPNERLLKRLHHKKRAHINDANAWTVIFLEEHTPKRWGRVGERMEWVPMTGSGQEIVIVGLPLEGEHLREHLVGSGDGF